MKIINSIIHKSPSAITALLFTKPLQQLVSFYSLKKPYSNMYSFIHIPSTAISLVLLSIKLLQQLVSSIINKFKQQLI